MDLTYGMSSLKAFKIFLKSSKYVDHANTSVLSWCKIKNLHTSTYFKSANKSKPLPMFSLYSNPVDRLPEVKMPGETTNAPSGSLEPKPIGWRQVGATVGVGAAFVGGVGAAYVGAPLLLGALGFGSVGITGGSLAAKAMSVAWTKGLGVAAIGAAQSAGATGVISGSTAVLSGTAAAGSYAMASKIGDSSKMADVASGSLDLARDAGKATWSGAQTVLSYSSDAARRVGVIGGHMIKPDEASGDTLSGARTLSSYGWDAMKLAGGAALVGGHAMQEAGRGLVTGGGRALGKLTGREE